ncbi:MAG: lysoplasmalogenase family protein, partial [Bacteroidota bacterium]
MRKRYWVFIFLFVLLVHIAGIYTQNAVIEKITKPVLIVVLAACFISTTYKVSSGIKKWILVALFFSWVGDILLMFVDTSSVYFLAGLASFLVAHIFFIFFFHAVRLQEGIKGKIFLLIPVLIYYVILMEILSPGLG